MAEPEAECGAQFDGGRSRSADLDLEMALLAVLASRDMGQATERVRLDTLSPIDKEVLLQLIRGKLGLAENPPPAASENSCADDGDILPESGGTT